VTKFCLFYLIDPRILGNGRGRQDDLFAVIVVVVQGQALLHLVRQKFLQVLARAETRVFAN